MRRRPLAQRVTATVDAVEHTVAIVVIRAVGILGAMTFLSLAVYECVRFTKDVWLGR